MDPLFITDFPSFTGPIHHTLTQQSKDDLFFNTKTADKLWNKFSPGEYFKSSGKTLTIMSVICGSLTHPILCYSFSDLMYFR